MTTLKLDIISASSLLIPTLMNPWSSKEPFPVEQHISVASTEVPKIKPVDIKGLEGLSNRILNFK